jgi:carbon monoxide dehydrogenase subunit G
MKVAGEYTFDAPQELVWKALRDPDVLASIMPGGEGFEEVGENEYSGNLNVKVGPVQGKFQGNIQLSDIVEPESYTMAVDGKGPQGFVKASGRLHLTPQGNLTHMDYEGDAQVGGRIASVGQRLLDSSAKSIIRQSLEALNQYLKYQVATGAAGATAAAAETAATEATDVEQAEAERVYTEEALTSGEALAEASGTAEAVPEGIPVGVTPMAPATSPATPPQASKPSLPVPEFKPPSQTELAVNVAKDVAADLIPPRYRPILIGVIILLILLILYLIFT